MCIAGGITKLEKIVTINKKNRPQPTELKKHIKMIYLLGIFIIINTIKLTMFNYMIMYSKTFESLMYKMMYTLLISLVLYSLILKIKSRLLLIIFYVAQMIYMFAYLSYFSYFKSYLHLFQASALLTESVGPIMHLSIPMNFNMLIILIDLPVFISLMIHHSRINILNTVLKSHRRYIVSIALFLIFCFEGWNFYHNCSIIQISKNFFATEPQIIEKYGTIANNVSDIVFNYGGENLIKSFKYGKTVATFSSLPTSPNIIAIQVESMDSNVINQKYNGKYIAPYLNSLSKEGIYYPYTLSYHKAGGTSDSEFSIINSIEPLSDFPSIKISKYDYPNSLLKRLTKGNYNTMAYHGNAGAFYSRDVEFPKMGFKEFYDINKMGFSNVGWGAPDNDVFQYALSKMKKQRSPFFSYIITMSSHMPFTSVDNYYHNSNYNTIEDETVRNYFNSMSYVDKSIKNFVQHIKSIYPNSYILIWGDHTPGINNVDYKQASYTSENKYFEFVPLLIMTPDKKVYRENKNVASFLDIAPTILNASGLQFSIKSDGMDLIQQPKKIPKVPFKESFYDRNELFKQVSGQSKVSGEYAPNKNLFSN